MEHLVATGCWLRWGKNLLAQSMGNAAVPEQNRDTHPNHSKWSILTPTAMVLVDGRSFR